LLAWQSEDGGRSWSEPNAPFGNSKRPSLRIGADPVVAFGAGKTCWFCGVDYDWKIRGKPYYSSIKVSLSEDGGKTWKPPITVTEMDNGRAHVDKPWLAVDRSEGKRRGKLYVAWSRIDEDQNHCDLRCAALPPGARQFAPSVPLGEPVNLKGTVGAGHHVQLAVRPDGALDAVWRVAPSNRLVHAFSKDGARTFSEPVAISDEENTGVGQLPSLTATADGDLLVAWVHRGNVFCSVLASGRWCAPRRVDGQMPRGVGLSHPAVAATADTLWILAYRKDKKPDRLSVVLYGSTDRGNKWAEHCILASRELPEGKRREFSPGDYVGMAAAKSYLYAAYVLPGDGREEPRPRLHVSALVMRKER
jgi:hypothetical protein